MTIPSRLGFALLLLASGIFAACAQNGDFPSLLPRPGEGAAVEDPAEPAPDAVEAPAADPALAARLTQLVDDAQAGQQAFQEQLARTRTAIARAGAAESESWIEAHLALSRLESARTPTVNAAAEVDALALDRSRAGSTTSAADLAAIAAASERIDALALAQREEISRLGTDLSGD